MNQMNNNNELPSNTDLIKEARTTNDCNRQVQLAGHTSDLVRAALTKNPSLCESALDELGDDLEKLRRVASKKLNGVILGE